MYRTRLHAKTPYIMKILVVNGPNLNLLGQREPGIYGTDSMEACLASLRERYADDEIDYYQSNVEGFLIDRLQQTLTDGTQGVVLNAGAYTHTSVALHDALRSLHVPVIEVHLSNVHRREAFRHTSLLTAACLGVIACAWPCFRATLRVPSCAAFAAVCFTTFPPPCRWALCRCC